MTLITKGSAPFQVVKSLSEDQLINNFLVYISSDQVQQIYP